MAGKLWFQQARRRLLGRSSACKDGIEQLSAAVTNGIPLACEPQNTNRSLHQETTRDQLESTTDEQLSSLFFARLPPELRRMIYAQVWSDAAGNGRMHLDSGGNADGSLRHVPCVVGHVHPGVGHTASAQSLEPRMLWWALNQRLALHWAAHAECARTSHLRPIQYTSAPEAHFDDNDYEQGEEEEERPGQEKFLCLFLICKRLYSESITTLFETTTFIFQSSIDATAFFTPPEGRLSNRYFPALRSIEINLAYEYDHVYLHKIANTEGHPRLPGADSVVVGMAAWDRLVRALAAAVPELGGLDVYICGMPTMGKCAFADTFDAVGWKPDRLRLQFSTGLQR